MLTSLVRIPVVYYSESKNCYFFFFHVALQYASSQALKTDLTRTGKRTFTGMLRGN